MNSEYILTVHDDLLSNLILLNCNNIIYNKDYPTKLATISGTRADVSLESYETEKLDKFVAEEKRKHTTNKLTSSDDYKLKNSYSLTAQEIVVYLILLHNYIMSEQDYAVISIKQINKEYRQIRSINDKTFDAYIKALIGLNKKTVYFNIKNKYIDRKRLRNYQDKHNLLHISKIVQLENDYQIIYSLGTFGKIIRDGHNYSSIAPKDTYAVSFSGINYLLVMMYLSRMIYINRRKKQSKPVVRLSLSTICQNINKYNKQGYNTNITYADEFYNAVELAKNLEFNVNFYESLEDDYSRFNSRKQEYYQRLIKSHKKRAYEAINKNRDLKLIIRNIRYSLTRLKQTNQIKDFYLVKPNKCKEDEEYVYWKDVNCNNWSEYVIDIALIEKDI